MLDGTQSVFSIDATDATLMARAAALDVHPTGVLWGVGGAGQGDAASYEAQLLQQHPALCSGLERSGVKQARRALRMRLLEPQLAWETGAVRLSFVLPRGSFATAVLGELLVAN
ncbi:hypothetical protein HSBAA_49710 [Vreelandella sulfidaeris]|uniref:TRUD domain-containing protein n=1 Tax=Vreelandella sulfidaeris TaxID=115553 RepID=A0A455UC92_9GAMM|nr:hypothetical protein HSBAA_49710 [Halomonas sulfidaeris]